MTAFRFGAMTAAAALFYLVTEWVGGGVDAQLGARVTLTRVRFEAGKKSGARAITATGGTVTEFGTEYVPWGGAE